MGVHAALGLAGRARGVGHHAKIIRPGGGWARAQGTRQHVDPERHTGRNDGLARRCHDGWQWQVGLLVQVVAVGRDQQLLQAGGPALAQQGGDLRVQVLRHQGRARAAVGHVVTQLLGAVHRIDWHDHGVRPQNAVIGQHPLRAVLHVEQYAVTRLHPARLLQPSRQALAFLAEGGVAQGRVVVDDEGFVGIAGGGDLDVVPEAGLRQGQVLRQADRPVGEVA